MLRSSSMRLGSDDKFSTLEIKFDFKYSSLSSERYPIGLIDSI